MRALADFFAGMPVLDGGPYGGGFMPFDITLSFLLLFCCFYLR